MADFFFPGTTAPPLRPLLTMLPFRLAVLLTVPTLFVSPGVAQEVPGWAQPPSAYASSPPPALPPAPPAVSVPVDGGLALLALAGAGYAARRLRQRRE